MKAVSDTYDLHSEFDIELHKKTFVNYLEVIIERDGHIMYAVPSHQECAIRLACKEKGWTRDELAANCPPEFYFDFLTWVLSLTDSVSVWNGFFVGKPNQKQHEALKLLKENGLYKGNLEVIPWKTDWLN